MNQSVLCLVFKCVFPGIDLAVRQTIQTRRIAPLRKRCANANKPRLDVGFLQAEVFPSQHLADFKRRVGMVKKIQRMNAALKRLNAGIQVIDGGEHPALAGTLKAMFLRWSSVLPATALKTMRRHRSQLSRYGCAEYRETVSESSA